MNAWVLGNMGFIVFEQPTGFQLTAHAFLSLPVHLCMFPFVQLFLGVNFSSIFFTE